MNENEFREKYSREKHIFQSWGEYIRLTIQENLKCQGMSLDILKIPAIPRVKDEDSIIAKAFYRDKKYLNPYDDITDKVGIRFVVLTTDDINIIKEIVEGEKSWKFSEDVDYERNIKIWPEVFNYQSVHYIVRSVQDFEYNKIMLPSNVPCEIQIRTLLQHAYAELSHDTVYKKNEDVPIHVKRVLARSMALIETTDVLFKEVYDVLRKEESIYAEFEKWARKYRLFSKETENLNKFIFVNYKQLLNENSITILDIENFMQSRLYLCDKIKVKQETNILYRQPVIFLLFYLVKNKKRQMLADWPLEEVLLEPIFTDIGESCDF